MSAARDYALRWEASFADLREAGVTLQEWLAHWGGRQS